MVNTMKSVPNRYAFFIIFLGVTTVRKTRETIAPQAFAVVPYGKTVSSL